MKFKIGVFIITLVVISILTGLSLIAAAGRDEGTLMANDGLTWNFLADSFNFFRLPTHRLFWNLITKDMGFLFLPTLGINAIFWSLVSERLIALMTRAIGIMRLKGGVR